MKMYHAQALRSVPSATEELPSGVRMNERSRDNRWPSFPRQGGEFTQVNDPTDEIHELILIRLLELQTGLQDDTFSVSKLAVELDLREIGLLYYVMASSEQLADSLVTQALQRYKQ